MNTKRSGLVMVRNKKNDFEDKGSRRFIVKSTSGTLAPEWSITNTNLVEFYRMENVNGVHTEHKKASSKLMRPLKVAKGGFEPPTFGL